MKRFVIVGVGSFGRSVAEQLAAMHQKVVVLDQDPEKVARFATLALRAVAGDGTDPQVLAEAGAGEADAAIVSLGRDVTASVLAVLALRDLGIREIHVKTISELHGRILDKIGVAETIFPERESGTNLARRIASSAILRYVELGPGLSAQEMAVPQEWVGRSLRELELPRRYRITVIGARDYLSGETTASPDPDEALKDSDTLIVAGTDDDLRRAASLK